MDSPQSLARGELDGKFVELRGPIHVEVFGDREVEESGLVGATHERADFVESSFVICRAPGKTWSGSGP